MKRSPFGRYRGTSRNWVGGLRWEFKFKNTYGASVVKFPGSYGYESNKWELAIINKDGNLDYKTGITDDVIGWLSENEVENLLDRISKLSFPIETTSTEVKGILE